MGAAEACIIYCKHLIYAYGNGTADLSVMRIITVCKNVVFTVFICVMHRFKACIVHINAVIDYCVYLLYHSVVSELRIGEDLKFGKVAVVRVNNTGVTALK